MNIKPLHDVVLAAEAPHRHRPPLLLNRERGNNSTVKNSVIVYSIVQVQLLYYIKGIQIMRTLLVMYSSSTSLSSMLKCLSNASTYASRDPRTLQQQ